MQTSQIMGRGVYSIAQASRYTGLKPATVGRWAFGYRNYSSIVDPDLPRIGEDKAISFLTLVELLLMRRFQESGIPADKVRAAAGKLAAQQGIIHPFAFEHLGRYLQHDNRDFFGRNDPDDDWVKWTGKNTDQAAWDAVLAPFLHEVEFEGEYVRRWFPPETARLVVLDPSIRFGEPVISGTRIPTANLLDQIQGGDSVEFVAECYGLSVEQVQAAEGFELRTKRAA